MSIDDLNGELEQRLRSSLSRQAERQSGHGADLADIFGRARGIRRRRTALVASAAAVAVAAVAVPVGVLAASRDAGAPPPSVGTVSATPSPTPAKTTTGEGLGGITMGALTTLTYIDPREDLHGSLPQSLVTDHRVTGFAPYHGGWLIAYSDNRITEVDSTGRVVLQGKGGTIVASSDGLETAWQIGQKVYAGISSGMGEGENIWDLKPTESLVGFVTKGPVISDGTGFTVLTGPTTRLGISSAITPTAASQEADAIGGVAGTVARGDQQGALADAKSGEIYWKGAWEPVSFSPDGRYVAAIPVGSGDPSEVAILDATTGTVLARTHALSDRIYLDGSVAWDGDAIVFGGRDADGQQETALLRLTPDGVLTRVSPMFRPAGAPDDPLGFVLMTR